MKKKLQGNDNALEKRQNDMMQETTHFIKHANMEEYEVYRFLGTMFLHY